MAKYGMIMRGQATKLQQERAWICELQDGTERNGATWGHCKYVANLRTAGSNTMGYHVSHIASNGLAMSFGDDTEEFSACQQEKWHYIRSVAYIETRLSFAWEFKTTDVTQMPEQLKQDMNRGYEVVAERFQEGRRYCLPRDGHVRQGQCDYTHGEGAVYRADLQKWRSIFYTSLFIPVLDYLPSPLESESFDIQV